MAATVQTEHPHVVQDPRICGGAPTVRGTRISVLQIAVMWREGDAVEEIVRSFPHLTAAQVHDAISYYLDHQREMELELQASGPEQTAARHNLELTEKGFFRVRKDGTGDGH